MKIINLTPHAVKDVESGMTFPPSGTVARVSVTRQCVMHHHETGVKVYVPSYGAVENLPPRQKNDTYFIVSAMVRAAEKDRWDIFSPGELVRDEKGNVIGCKGFDSNIELV